MDSQPPGLPHTPPLAYPSHLFPVGSRSPWERGAPCPGRSCRRSGRGAESSRRQVRTGQVRAGWTSSLWLPKSAQPVVWVITGKQNAPVPLLAECAFFPQRQCGVVDRHSPDLAGWVPQSRRLVALGRWMPASQVPGGEARGCLGGSVFRKLRVQASPPPTPSSPTGGWWQRCPCCLVRTVSPALPRGRWVGEA